MACRIDTVPVGACVSDGMRLGHDRTAGRAIGRSGAGQAIRPIARPKPARGALAATEP
jgi:hypothetical protein